MKYEPGTIIKYSEKTGFKRSNIYAIVLSQEYEDTVVVLPEFKEKEITPVHIDKKKYPESYSTIDEVLSSYEDIPENIEGSSSFSNERWYLRQIGEMLENVKKNSEKKYNNREESIH
jgi:fibrillarin-like rRNA methylase